MQTMEEKSQIIEQKLLKYESKDSDNGLEEEQKLSDNNQLVIYTGGQTSIKGENFHFNMGDSTLVPIITNESATT